MFPQSYSMCEITSLTLWKPLISGLVGQQERFRTLQLVFSLSSGLLIFSQAANMKTHM